MRNISDEEISDIAQEFVTDFMDSQKIRDEIKDIAQENLKTILRETELGLEEHDGDLKIYAMYDPGGHSQFLFEQRLDSLIDEYLSYHVSPLGVPDIDGITFLKSELENAIAKCNKLLKSTSV